VPDDQFTLKPIGWVESSLTDPSTAPKQGREGAPDAWLVLDGRYSEAVTGLAIGDEVMLLTWLDRGKRDLLMVHPRDNPANPKQGVFSTRSADRPNPIGLHRVEILDLSGSRIRVRPLEAIDRTPILDLKPVLDRALER
jgi:tRNA-Thr(GGU) m(6)t(6)A37 methyltransferase TsaA